MKVVKKVRLLSKDGKGLFKKDGQHDILRKRAVISDASIKDSEDNHQTTGILYIIDKKATAERNKSIEKPGVKEVINTENK